MLIFYHVSLPNLFISSKSLFGGVFRALCMRSCHFQTQTILLHLSNQFGFPPPPPLFYFLLLILLLILLPPLPVPLPLPASHSPSSFLHLLYFYFFLFLLFFLAKIFSPMLNIILARIFNPMLNRRTQSGKLNLFLI